MGSACRVQQKAITLKFGANSDPYQMCVCNQEGSGIFLADAADWLLNGDEAVLGVDFHGFNTLKLKIESYLY